MKGLGLALCCLAAAWAAFGEVYWSDPAAPAGGGAGGAGPAVAANSWPFALGFLPCWSEPLIANGTALELEVGISRRSLREIVAAVASLRPAPRILADASSLYLAWPLADGGEQRLFLTAGQADLPAVVFAMKIPAGPLPPPIWPASLPPLPPGAVAELVQEYPKRGAAYGYFSTATGQAATLSALAAQLRSGGWKALGTEADSPDAGGEIFHHPPSGRIALIAAGERDGMVFCRPVQR